MHFNQRIYGWFSHCVLLWQKFTVRWVPIRNAGTFLIAASVTIDLKPCLSHRYCVIFVPTHVFLKTVGVVSTSKVSLCTHCGNFPASVIESIILCKPLYVFDNYGKLSFCVVAEPVILYLLVRSMSFRKRCDQTWISVIFNTVWQRYIQIKVIAFCIKIKVTKWFI